MCQTTQEWVGGGRFLPRPTFRATAPLVLLPPLRELAHGRSLTGRLRCGWLERREVTPRQARRRESGH